MAMYETEELDQPIHLHREDLYRVLRAAKVVLEELGCGYNKKPYENALILECISQGIPFRRNPAYDITFKGHKVGRYVPDLVVFEAVIVDTRVMDRITDYERCQMLNYLRITKLPVGLILNYARSTLEWERVFA